MSNTLPKVERCLNCDAPVAGNFCQECGQKADDRTVSIRLLLADTFVDLVNLDSRVFRSLGSLLFRPGFLTSEYVAGRRTRYTSPLRLYVAMSVVFFLVLFWNINLPDLGPGLVAPVPPPDASLLVIPQIEDVPSDPGLSETAVPPPAPPVPPEPAGPPRSGPFDLEGKVNIGPIELELADLSKTLEQYEAEQQRLPAADRDSSEQQYLTRQAIRLRRNPREFVGRLKDNIPKMMFFLLPFFALILKAIYLRSRRYYVEHLIFSLHSHAFVFLLLTLSLLFKHSGVTQALMAVAVLYLFLSMRRVYGQSWKKTAFKFSLLGVSYAILLVFYLIGTVLITVVLA